MALFGSTVNRSIDNILIDAVNGKYPIRIDSTRERNKFGSGVSVFLGDSDATSITPNTRKIVSLTPRSSVLVKKKAFSTFKGSNDLQWMDRTEKMLLRCTKALFAYKVAQIRAYESLTKFESFFQENTEISLTLFAELLHNAKFLIADPAGNQPQPSGFLGGLTTDISRFILGDKVTQAFGAIGNAVSSTLRDVAYDEIKQDVLLLLERNAFSTDLELTTWIVDPNDLSNYGTGPGTGVIELGMSSSFTTTTNLNSEPSSADLKLEDPYRIMNISSEDIEVAINEGLLDSLGLLSELSNPASPPIDIRSSLSAGLSLVGLGNLDGTINVDYIRDRLRVFYLGKPIVNPGDGIHFFIRSNKALQDFGNTEDIFDDSFVSIDETILEAERILFTSGNIDFETYKNIRQFSDNSFAMHHVFGGFVTGTSESWGGGRWTLDVKCRDNMGWLQWSRFMFEPALQDPQGILEDPLTPYELKRDASGQVLTGAGIELLEENKSLIRSGLLFYESGILNGQVATENNLLQGQYNKSGSLSEAKILQHPHGLVYRWKDGILTATASVHVTDTINEKDVTQAVHNQRYGLTVAENVLNNLDIANILSLLIVGQPYNVETFVNQAYDAQNILKKTTTSSLSVEEPITAVLDAVRRQNNFFGNFKPYRLITLSNQTLTQTANSNFLRNETNDNIRKLQQRRVEIDALLRRLSSQSFSNGILIKSLEQEKANIDSAISAEINFLRASGEYSSVDILTNNFNLFGNSKTLPLTGNQTADHQVTRAMTVVGAQRRIEDVRLNRDQNLFIVSDQYDEQTDIRPFIFKLRDSNFKIFRGQFVSVFDKCSAASKFANLEFFSNSQGHLEFRPPQWNRTPLTVLQELFRINSESDKNIIPEFLTEMFQTRSDSLRREIHKLNIRIVILALLLNRYPDSSLIPNFDPSSSNVALPGGIGKGSASLKFFGVEEAGVKEGKTKGLELKNGSSQFGLGSIVDTGDQILGDGVLLSAGLGAEGDILNGDTQTLLGVFDPVFQEDTNVIQGVLKSAALGSSQTALSIANAQNLNNLREAFVKLSGLDPANDLVQDNGKFLDASFIIASPSSARNPEAERVARAQSYIRKLESTISERDGIVTILQRNLEKEQELEEIGDILVGEFAEQEPNPTTFLEGVEDFLDRASNTLRTVNDIFTGNANEGTLFDHLVEDDTRNLLGPGSGRRFILRDEDIISCTFSEQPPNFTRVDVIGDAPIIGDALQQVFENRYFWAGATDFDLWRQFGYKYGTVNLPFASSSELQSKPYAIMELQLQRVKINTGSVSVVGNEYYEPGDVVYLPTKGLLYYVRGVTHSYRTGEAFTTNLTLEFGHPPGVYLPSPLDIIGQQFTKDPLKQGSTLVYRNSQGDDNYRVLQPDNALVFPPNQDITTDNIHILLDYKDNALRFNNMMTALSSLLIGNRVVLLRGFVRGQADENLDTVRNNLEVIKFLLQNPVSVQQDNPTSLSDDLLNGASGVFRGLGSNVGNNKSTTPLTLPNGLPAAVIPAEKIIEQVVFLERRGSSSQIQCLNADLFSSNSADGSQISAEDIDAVFPKGGPKQRTWLDIRDENDLIPGVGSISITNTYNVSMVIEIGILDIARSLDISTQEVNIGV